MKIGDKRWIIRSINHQDIAIFCTILYKTNPKKGIPILYQVDEPTIYFVSKDELLTQKKLEAEFYILDKPSQDLLKIYRKKKTISLHKFNKEPLNNTEKTYIEKLYGKDWLLVRAKPEPN